MIMIRQIRRSLVYKYKSLRDGWHFPSDMTHTSGYKMVTHSYEPEVSREITSILSGGDLFWDVGANVGYFSKLASTEVGSSGEVMAFEADPENFKALCGNTERDGNILPLHTAVTDKNGSVSLSRSTHACCHSTVDTDNYISGVTKKVPAQTLDMLSEEYLTRHTIKLVKIDVEGAEIDVLKGAKNILAGGIIKNMIIEYCPRIMNNAGYEIIELYTLLAAHFELRVIEEEHRVISGGKLSSREDFLKLTRHLLSYDHAKNSNLLCTS